MVDLESFTGMPQSPQQIPTVAVGEIARFEPANFEKFSKSCVCDTNTFYRSSIYNWKIAFKSLEERWTENKKTRNTTKPEDVTTLSKTTLGHSATYNI